MKMKGLKKKKKKKRRPANDPLFMSLTEGFYK